MHATLANRDVVMTSNLSNHLNDLCEVLFCIIFPAALSDINDFMT